MSPWEKLGAAGGERSYVTKVGDQVCGVGYYRLDISDESFPSAFSGTDNDTGWNAGAGVSFSLRKIDIFVEARYHSVRTGEERFKFVPVSIGLVF